MEEERNIIKYYLVLKIQIINLINIFVIRKNKYKKLKIVLKKHFKLQ